MFMATNITINSKGNKILWEIWNEVPDKYSGGGGGRGKWKHSLTNEGKTNTGRQLEQFFGGKQRRCSVK